MIAARFRALTAHSKQIRTEALVSAAKGVQSRHVAEAIKKLKKYPPPIPTSNYVRTGDLGRGWQIDGPRETADGLICRAVNSVRYAHFVQGEDQVAIHQGRWTRLDEVLDRQGYMNDLRSMIRGLIV